MRMLLEIAPWAALTKDARGRLPLHIAARWGSAELAQLLLEAAPAAAMAELAGHLPLEIALFQAQTEGDPARFLSTARLLLPATLPERALAALEQAGEIVLHLFVDLAACVELSPAQWQRVPAPCPDLGAALPAVLARSEAEAALPVGCLPAKMRRRLRAGALCLGRAQRVRHMELPAALVGQVLALAAGP